MKLRENTGTPDDYGWLRPATYSFLEKNRASIVMARIVGTEADLIDPLDRHLSFVEQKALAAFGSHAFARLAGLAKLACIIFMPADIASSVDAFRCESVSHIRHLLTAHIQA